MPGAGFRLLGVIIGRTLLAVGTHGEYAGNRRTLPTIASVEAMTHISTRMPVCAYRQSDFILRVKFNGLGRKHVCFQRFDLETVVISFFRSLLLFALPPCCLAQHF